MRKKTGYDIESLLSQTSTRSPNAEGQKVKIWSDEIQGQHNAMSQQGVKLRAGECYYDDWVYLT